MISEFYEEQVDGETLFYMNDLNLLKPFKISYKNQIMFLKEREKLFSSKTVQEKPKSPAASNDTPSLIIDVSETEVLEDEDPLIQLTINSSNSTTITSINDTPKEQPLPDPYLLPILPDQVIEAINLKQMIKFEKLCNFRAVVVDAVFHDLKTNYNILYPTRAQYTSIVISIFNHLGIEYDSKTANSWRESLISKYKRERQNLSNDRITEMKLRYSKVNSGRKLKELPTTQLSERIALKTISAVETTFDDLEEIQAKAEEINKIFQVTSSDDPSFKRLWSETYLYRQAFIKQNTAADIMKQFPVYSNPSLVLADVKVLTGVDLDYSVKEKLNILSNKISSDNQFLTDSSSIRCLKVLCGILDDSWKHYICFYPERPATPQPTIVVEDDNIKIYFDWIFICSLYSIEQSLAVLVGLYCLMNLKFPAHRTAVRFLYAYFLNDKHQQSNNIRKFCKKYNVEIGDKPSSSLSQLEETTNNNILDLHATENTDDQLTVVSKEINNEETHNDAEGSISPLVPVSATQQTTNKRKAHQFIDQQHMNEENSPPSKKTRSATRANKQS